MFKKYLLIRISLEIDTKKNLSLFDLRILLFT